MNATEIASLVVRLGADVTRFVGPMQYSAQVAASTAAQVQGSASRIEAITGELRGYARAALGALAGFGLATSLRGAFQAFDQFNRTLIRLRAAIEVTGRAAQPVIDDYDAFAKQIAATTLTTRGAVLAMAQQAESMGLTGEAAKRLVRDSIALGAATGTEAQQWLRVAQYLQRGHPEFAARILGLRDITNASELAAKVQERLKSGLAIARAEAGSVGGQITRLGRAFAGLTISVGEMIATAVQPAVDWLTRMARVINAAVKPAAESAKAAVRDATAAVVGWVDRNRTLVAAAAAVAAALAAVYAAYRLVRLAIAATLALAAALHVQQVIGIAGWLAWQAVTLAASAAVALFNAQLAVWQALLAAGSALSLAWSAAAGVATAATWLWNAALAVLDALLAPEAILAAAAAVLALAGTVAVAATAFVAAGAAVYGVYQAGRAAFDVLSQLPRTAGPLQAVGNVLGEWLQIIKDVVAAAQVDLPLAWKIARAGAGLAVAEVRQLWPPLWAFIQAGVVALGELIAAVFKASFREAAAYGKAQILAALDFTGRGAAHDWAEDAKRMAKIAQVEAKAVRRQSAEDAVKALNDAATKFKLPADGDAVKAAREELEALRQQLGQALKDTGAGADKLGPGLNQAIVAPVKEATKEVAKFDAALFGSAEAVSRVAEFEELVRTGRAAKGGEGAGKRVEAEPFGGPETYADAGGAALPYLARIAASNEKLVEQGRSPGLRVETAGLA